MEQNTNVRASGGIGFVGLLTIAFIVLKLVGVISWSWFWVLSPIIISLVLGIGFVIVLSIIGLILVNKNFKDK